MNDKQKTVEVLLAEANAQNDYSLSLLKGAKRDLKLASRYTVLAVIISLLNVLSIVWKVLP